MKRKFVLIVLALVLAFGAVSVVNAKVTSATLSTNRTSNTSANVSASASFDGVKDSITCTITYKKNIMVPGAKRQELRKNPHP